MLMDGLTDHFASWAFSLIAIVTASTGAATWLFKQYGAGWLKSRFDRDLEEFKSQKNTELESIIGKYTRETEQIKAYMNRYIDRAVKLNEKQYQILPEAWSLLSKAHGATYTALHNYINFPDINDLSADELSAFLDSKELSISQKEKIKQSQNKNLDYRNGISWCYVQAADKACVEYLNYLIINGIFIEQAILDKMTAASSKLRNAVTFRQFNDPDLGATDEFITAHTDILDAGDIVQELRQEIRAHLTEVDPRPIRP